MVNQVREMPKVYIVVVNWNGRNDTLECLASLMDLDYPRHTVVAVDNASSDGSVKEIRLRFPQVTILQAGANLGFAGGNNVGIRHALEHGADYVWILNNDTVVAPDALTRLLERMQAKTDAGMCGSKLVYYHDRRQVQALGGATYNRWFCIPKHLGRNSDVDAAVDVEEVEARLDYVVGASLLVSRRFVETIGLMNEDYFLYFEELDWAARARGRFSLAYAENSIVYHKEGASIGGKIDRPLERSSISDYYWMRNRLIFTRKFYPYALPTAYVSLLLALFNRVRRRQWDRVRMSLSLLGGRWSRG